MVRMYLLNGMQTNEKGTNEMTHFIYDARALKGRFQHGSSDEPNTDRDHQLTF